MPAGAECGLLSVPVDYAKPDGDVAQIAMIRFQPTGAKISLVINPGGPGESGIEAAVGLADATKYLIDLTVAPLATRC